MYVLQYLCALRILYARPVEDGFNVGDNKKEDEIWNLTKKSNWLLSIKHNHDLDISKAQLNRIKLYHIQ